MGKMLIDYGLRGTREIDVPDHATGVNVSPRIKVLGEWVGEAVQSRLVRHEHVDALRRAGWLLTNETKPHFDAIAKDVQRFKGSAISMETEDFYDWIKDPDIQKQLPNNTSEVIKSSADNISDLVAMFMSGDNTGYAKAWIERYTSSEPDLSLEQGLSEASHGSDELDADTFTKLLNRSRLGKSSSGALSIGHETAKGEPKSSPADDGHRTDNEGGKPDGLTY